MSFLDLVNAAIEERLAELHTAMPARIMEYDPAKQEAVVQPLIKRRYYDADNNPKGLVDQPPIVAVPVVFPSAATGIISFPIKKGDIVLLIFSELSVDNFNFSDGQSTVDPDDFRRFHYSDAIAIPGLYPFNRAIGSDPDNLAIRFNVGGNESSIKFKPNGDVQITTSGKTIVNATGTAEVTAASATVNCNTTINGNLNVNGNIECSQTVTGTTDVIGGGKSLKTHPHSGVTPGGGVSGPPV